MGGLSWRLGPLVRSFGEPRRGFCVSSTPSHPHQNPVGLVRYFPPLSLNLTDVLAKISKKVEFEGVGKWLRRLRGKLGWAVACVFSFEGC